MREVARDSFTSQHARRSELSRTKQPYWSVWGHERGPLGSTQVAMHNAWRDASDLVVTYRKCMDRQPYMVFGNKYFTGEHWVHQLFMDKDDLVKFQTLDTMLRKKQEVYKWISCISLTQ